MEPGRWSELSDRGVGRAARNGCAGSIQRRPRVLRDRRRRPGEVYSPRGQTPWETFAIGGGFRVRDVLTLELGMEGPAGEQGARLAEWFGHGVGVILS